MEDMINLSDLLKHEILDIYSAEEQIIEGLPAMIEKASNSSLKKALREHLAVTKEQKNRLDQIKEWMGEDSDDGRKNKGFFSRMLSGGSEGEKCKAMEGLIKEAEKMMSEDASEEVCDAAIIASAQKIEHYEIASYGTARTYARELQLNEVADLLEQTLSEEYQADDLLTKLAMTRINLEAQAATSLDNGAGSSGRGRKSSTTKASSSSGNRSSSSSDSRSSQGSKSSQGRSSDKKSTSETTKASSNGRSGSSKNQSSSKASSSKSSRSGGSSRSASSASTGRGQKSTKRSTATKKATRSKSRASR